MQERPEPLTARVSLWLGFPTPPGRQPCAVARGAHRSWRCHAAECGRHDPVAPPDCGSALRIREWDMAQGGRKGSRFGAPDASMDAAHDYGDCCWLCGCSGFKSRLVLCRRRPSLPVRLFLGSSSEGREVARNLQVELGDGIEVVRWDQSVFEPGGYTLDSLIAAATSVDFAVLVATPDDTTVSRGEMTPSARDNIVLEFGLFAGALGRKRTYLLATGELKLPTDVLGLTRLPYRPQSNCAPR